MNATQVKSLKMFLTALLLVFASTAWAAADAERGDRATGDSASDWSFSDCGTPKVGVKKE